MSNQKVIQDRQLPDPKFHLKFGCWCLAFFSKNSQLLEIVIDCLNIDLRRLLGKGAPLPELVKASFFNTDGSVFAHGLELTEFNQLVDHLAADT